MRKILIKNEKGAALVLTLILIVVIPIFLGAILKYGLSAQKSVIFNKRNKQAYYLARAGAEAVIESWKSYDLSEKPELNSSDNTAKIDTLYFTNDKKFTRVKPEGEYIGSVDVTVKKQDDQTTTFTSVANVDGRKQVITATLSAYVDAEKLDWYDYYYDSGFLGWVSSEGYLINPGSNTETINFEGRSYNVKYHDPITGAVEIGDSSLTMTLRNNKNKVAYIADMLIFNSGIDFSNLSFSSYGGLIVVGETIVFKKSITIEDRATDNTLVLSVPDGLGVKLKNRGGLYGKVYFKDYVEIDRAGSDEIIIGENSFYYFKKREEGINLLKINDNDGDGKFEDSDGNEVMIPIPADDQNIFIPEPEEELRILWN